MMLQRLEARGVRNIHELSISFSPGVNTFVGANGSGKTSILEAIHLLGTGRGFRSHKQAPLITHGQDSCVVFGELARDQLPRVPIGVSRSVGGKREFRLAGETCHRSSDLAAAMPVLVIAPETLEFLTRSPEARRRFMNWGVFHVEPSFSGAWQSAQHCVQQRNALLKHDKIDADLLRIWTEQYYQAAQSVHGSIKNYLDNFVPVFKAMSKQVLNSSVLEMVYAPGWPESNTLAARLQATEAVDRVRGYTGSGHHRSDFRILQDNREIGDVMSRGQQKLVAVLLMLSQAELLKISNHKSCVLLLDDLGSELDHTHRKRLAQLILELDCQVMFTATDAATVDDFWATTATKRFHVEQGTAVPALEKQY